MIMQLKKLSYSLVGSLMWFTVLCVALWTQNVPAHGGAHAGPVVEQMNKETALELTLPKSVTVIKKLEAVNQEAVAWAEATYGVRLKEGLYRYFLAQDEQSGEIVGGAIVRRSKFRQGKLTLTVGLDAEQHVTNIALMSINKNYLLELETDFTEGVISTYRGQSVEQVTNAKALSFANKTEQAFAIGIRDATVLLATLMSSKRHADSERKGG